jgi:hypothetical protein
MSENKPISSAKANAGCVFVFFGIFSLAGAAMFCLIFAPVAYHVIQARSWPAVRCRIVSCKLVASGGGHNPAYRVAITFKYEFGGHDYQSNRYEFMTDSSSFGASDKRAAVKRLRHGTWATCYVDPDHPDHAVIDRSWTSTTTFILIFSLVFMSIGILVPKFIIKRIKTFSSPIPAQEQVPRGEFVLKPKMGPVAGLVTAMFMAVFWNGIVSIFVYQFLRGGDRSLGSGIFLTPFVCIGLGMVVWVVVRFLALFDPRPQLRLANGYLTPGATTELRWQFTGRYDRISRLRMSLQGREEATYQAGKNSNTVSKTFVDSALFDSTRGVEIQKGKAKLTIPPGTMHSFRAASNRIIWSIHLKAEIAGLPNLKEEFPLIVAPGLANAARESS